MVKFITLTEVNSDLIYVVNTDHIVQFSRDKGATYTLVDLSNGKSHTVKETPADIRMKLGA